MEFLKNNWVVVLCGAIIVVSLALLWPVSSYGRRIEETMQQRGPAKLSQLRKYFHSSNPYKTVNGNRIGAVNEDLITRILDRQRAISQQYERVLKLVKDINRREPLMNGVFPELSSPVLPLTYKNRYNQRFHEFLKQLKATTVPTNEEIERALAHQAEQLTPRGGSPLAGVGRSERVTLTTEQQEETIRQLAISKSYEGLIYADLNSFYMDDWAFSTVPARVEMLWHGQLGLWIQQDLVQAIINMNTRAPHKTVQTAPVKHLKSVTIDGFYATAQPAGGPPMTMSRGGSGLSGPSITDILWAESTPQDRLYDVMRFTFTVVIDSRDVSALLNELSKMNYITVTNLQFEAVNYEQASKQMYVYGSDPVIELTVFAEYAFLRDAYKDLMPKQVRIDLGIEEPSNQ